MGRIIEKVKIENIFDINDANEGRLDASEIRSVELNAIVDTGAAFMSLPPEAIAQLGLFLKRTVNLVTANGRVVRRVFSGARITIRERDIDIEVVENDGATPPLIGYLVLEALDFVPDPMSQKLIGNPEHDGEWLVDMY